MLYSFLNSLVEQFSALNVFRYLTFRTGLSVMSSMIIVFLVGGPFIKFIESHKFTGPIRDDGSGPVPGGARGGGAQEGVYILKSFFKIRIKTSPKPV